MLVIDFINVARQLFNQAQAGDHWYIQVWVERTLC